MAYFEEKGFYHGNLSVRNVLVAVDRDDCGCATDANGYTAKVMDLTNTLKNTGDGIKGDVADFGTILKTIICRFLYGYLGNTILKDFETHPHYYILVFVISRQTKSYQVIFLI